MEIRLLGPLEVRDGNRTIALPRRQQRALLAALALRAGQVVSTERLVADLWGEHAPASATGSLQNTVSALRKLLGRDVLVTQAPGYRLGVSRDAVDVNRFERLLAEAQNAEPPARVALLREALDLWRGPALADLDEEEFARLEAARLDELRVTALEQRLDAELELGRHASLVGELEQLVATHPLRERMRGQLMLALYRCGRQAEALEVYRAARLALADELGLDPSPELQELERRVLRQDASLAAPEETSSEAAPAADRKLVSVLFATPPAEDDAEALRRRLDELLARARDILARHGGVLERFGPEGLVAVFGADSPRDDDALSAVRAAAELGLPAGVATGESVDGAGAVFVRAAELARRAGVQVDERTRALVQHERRLDAPLVGRTEELSRLRAAFDATRTEGRCRVVSVLGEPGIGKTRLGRELVASLGGEATSLVGRCVSYGGGSTFLPLLDALDDLDVAAVMSGEPDEDVAVQRLVGLGGATDPGTIGESYWAIRRLLETLAVKRPVVLLLDDVHWAEPALLDLVDYLAERITNAPVLVVCLARPEVARTSGDLLALGPLSDEEARELVAGVVELDEETRERIVALAEGNALYAEQLGSFAAEGGEGLPPTLEAVLAGRLGRLDDAERAVLQRAAVVGREFSRSALAALSDEPVDTALASLSRRGFVHAAGAAEPADDGYRFHHVLLRDTAYGSLTKADRADLHERAAEWLDRDGAGDDALVGYHLERAAQLRRELGEDADALAERAGERLGDAAMRAWRQNDTRAAIGLLLRATALLPAGERRGELLCELALAELLGDGEGAQLSQAAEDAHMAGSRRLSSRIAVERALHDFASGGVSASELLETALGTIDVLTAAGDYRALGRAWFAVSLVHGWACRYADAAEAARIALEGYARASFSPAAVNGVLSYSVLYGPIPVEEAIHLCSGLRDTAPDRLSKAHATVTLGALGALEQRFEDARLLCAEGREVYESIGTERMVTGLWSSNAMLVERRAGALDAAAAIARDASRYFAEQGERSFESTWAARLAELLYWGGEYEEAARAVAVARDRAVEHDVYVQFLWRSAAAKLAAREGRTKEADRLITEALRLAAASDSPLLLADLWVARADVFEFEGRPVEAAEATEQARKLLLGKGDLAGLAELERLLPNRQTKSPSGLSV